MLQHDRCSLRILSGSCKIFLVCNSSTKFQGVHIFILFFILTKFISNCWIESSFYDEILSFRITSVAIRKKTKINLFKIEHVYVSIKSFAELNKTDKSIIVFHL